MRFEDLFRHSGSSSEGRAKKKTAPRKSKSGSADSIITAVYQGDKSSDDRKESESISSQSVLPDTKVTGHFSEDSHSIEAAKDTESEKSFLLSGDSREEPLKQDTAQLVLRGEDELSLRTWLEEVVDAPADAFVETPEEEEGPAALRDGTPTGEIESYYRKPGPNDIKREDFNRYKAYMCRQVDALVLLNLRLARPKEFQGEKLSAIIRADLTQYRKMRRNLRNQRLGEIKRQERLILAPRARGEPNLPTYYPGDDDVDPLQGPLNTFLFPDLESRLMEMKLRLQLLRVQTAIQAGRYEKSMQLCNEAEAIDQKLNVPCLHGKVGFWKGFTSLKLDQPDQAVKCFEEAEAAKGHYREGQYAKVWAEFVRARSKSPGWSPTRVQLRASLGPLTSTDQNPGKRVGKAKH